MNGSQKKWLLEKITILAQVFYAESLHSGGLFYTNFFTWVKNVGRDIFFETWDRLQ